MNVVFFRRFSLSKFLGFVHLVALRNLRSDYLRDRNSMVCKSTFSLLKVANGVVVSVSSLIASCLDLSFFLFVTVVVSDNFEYSKDSTSNKCHNNRAPDHSKKTNEKGAKDSHGSSSGFSIFIAHLELFREVFGTWWSSFGSISTDRLIEVFARTTS